MQSITLPKLNAHGISDGVNMIDKLLTTENNIVDGEVEINNQFIMCMRYHKDLYYSYFIYLIWTIIYQAMY